MSNKNKYLMTRLEQYVHDAAKQCKKDYHFNWDGFIRSSVITKIEDLTGKPLVKPTTNPKGEEE